MKNKWLLYLVLFMLTANAALVTTMLIKNRNNTTVQKEYRDAPNKRFHNKPHYKFEDHLAKELDFNAEQINTVKIYRKEFMNERKKNRFKIFELRKEYFNILSQSNPDTSTLKNIATEIGNLEALKIKTEFTHYRNIRSVCTPEQAIKMDSLGRMHMHRKHKNKGLENKCRKRFSE